MSALIAALIIIITVIICIIIGALARSEERNYREMEASMTPVSKSVSDLRAQDFSAASLVVTAPGRCTVYEWETNQNFNSIESATPVTAQRSCLFPNEAALSLDTMTCTVNDVVLAQFPEARTTCTTSTGQVLRAGETITQWNECGSLRPCTFKLARISLKWSGTYDKSNCITSTDTPSLSTCVEANTFNDAGQLQTFVVEAPPGETTFGDTLPQWIALRSVTKSMYLSVQGDIVSYTVTPYYFLTLPSVTQVDTANTQKPRAQTLGLVGAYSPALTSSQVYAYNAPALVEVDGQLRVFRASSRYTEPQLTSTSGLNIIVL